MVLFPDLKGFEKWNTKAKELSTLASFTVSDLLERKATETEKQQGFDLADYLIKFDYRQFIERSPAETVETIFENWLHNNPQGGTFTHEQQVFEVWQKVSFQPIPNTIKKEIEQPTKIEFTGFSLSYLVTLAKAALQKNLSMNEPQQIKYLQLWFSEMQTLTTVTETEFLTAFKNVQYAKA